MAIQGIGYGVLEFFGVGTTLDIFLEYYITIFPIRRIGLHWIRRIELVFFVVFRECRNGYTVSSLVDTAYCECGGGCCGVVVEVWRLQDGVDGGDDVLVVMEDIVMARHEGDDGDEMEHCRNLTEIWPAGGEAPEKWCDILSSLREPRLGLMVKYSRIAWLPTPAPNAESPIKNFVSIRNTYYLLVKMITAWLFVNQSIQIMTSKLSSPMGIKAMLKGVSKGLRCNLIA
nr:hypothetical protein [Tanacetum cinerariifolium]